MIHLDKKDLYGVRQPAATPEDMEPVYCAVQFFFATAAAIYFLDGGQALMKNRVCELTPSHPVCANHHPEEPFLGVVCGIVYLVCLKVMNYAFRKGMI